MTLFQKPLTADDLQHLREAFADPKIAPSPPKKNPLAELRDHWIERPVLIGLLLFANCFASGLLLHLILNR